MSVIKIAPLASPVKNNKFFLGSIGLVCLATISLIVAIGIPSSKVDELAQTRQTSDMNEADSAWVSDSNGGFLHVVDQDSENSAVSRQALSSDDQNTATYRVAYGQPVVTKVDGNSYSVEINRVAVDSESLPQNTSPLDNNDGAISATEIVDGLVIPVDSVEIPIPKGKEVESMTVVPAPAIGMPGEYILPDAIEVADNVDILPSVPAGDVSYIVRDDGDIESIDLYPVDYTPQEGIISYRPFVDIKVSFRDISYVSTSNVAPKAISVGEQSDDTFNYTRYATHKDGASGLLKNTPAPILNLETGTTSINGVRSATVRATTLPTLRYIFSPLPTLPINIYRSFTGSLDFMSLFDGDTQWPITTENIQVFELFGEWLLDNHATDEELLKAVTYLKAHNIAIGISAGPLRAGKTAKGEDCGYVEGFARDQWPTFIRRIKAAGGQFDYISLDEPFYYAHVYPGGLSPYPPCNWEPDYIAGQVKEFVDYVRSEFPDVIVGETEPSDVVSNGTNGVNEFQEWFTALNKVGIRLAYLNIDVAWGRSNWPQILKSIESITKSNGIPFGVIYNGGPELTDEYWLSGAGEHVRTYETVNGGRPDVILFQSWHDKPDYSLPETKPFTYTNFIKTYIQNKALLGYNNIARGKSVSASHVQGGGENSASRAVDGEDGTAWSSGASPQNGPEWIQVDLGGCYDISGIQLVIAQWPSGSTTHNIYGITSSGTSQLLDTFAGNTNGGDILVYPRAQSLVKLPKNIRYIKIETTQSPSWVSWSEIRIQGVATTQNYTLTVTKVGIGSGTVTGSGINCGTTCTASYASGTSVTLTASAASGSTFAGWSGEGCSGTSTCTVTMSAAKTVTATFNTQYALSVTKNDNGAGTVAGGGINCGITCSKSYSSGTPVTLTASASAGKSFAGWGGACSGNSTCTVTMNAAKNVTATFNTLPSGVSLGEAVDDATSLTWTTGGNASWFGQTAVSYNGSDAAQSGDVSDSQSSWMQTTIADPGTISYWWKVSSESNYDYLRFYIDGTEQAGRISGDVNWQQKSFSIGAGSHTLKWTYTKDGSVSSGSDAGWVDKVVFTSGGGTTYALTVNKTGTGTVTGDQSPAINCGSACIKSYSSGTSVTLTAVPGSGKFFAGWSGDCSGTGLCTVTMNAPKTVRATFHANIALNKAVTSSGLQTGQNNVVDGNNDTLWNSGGGATQWIKIDLGDLYSISKIEMVPAYYTGSASTGPATNKIYAGNCGSETLVTTLSGNITDNVLITYPATGVLNLQNVRCVKIETTSSNSWVAWREIRVQGVKPSGQYSLHGSEEYSLQVSKNGAGRGTVTSDSGDINCGKTCEYSYDQDSTVSLTATPVSGSVFSGWSGACAGTETCDVPMTSDNTVTATFALQRYPLVLSVSGSGKVSYPSGSITRSACGIACSDGGKRYYIPGKKLELKAIPKKGYQFARWDGVACKKAACSFAMPSNGLKVSAIFEKKKK